jgi:hypothetical protein
LKQGLGEEMKTSTEEVTGGTSLFVLLDKYYWGHEHRQEDMQPAKQI